ncbi:SSI family serine proteinase inhibitor [Specibacter cremeus]|uniref:SSI family serine proteinase inhibitor n=1 Tax=Specibacter cremeus TaxID=1629051 RepID=UPI001F0C2559|nr:SSI family serine proteinase inhibitor [Specibacter cremeus]
MRGKYAATAAAMLAAALLAGCGGTTAGPGSSETSPSAGGTSGATSVAVTALTVTMRESNQATATKDFVLLCDGATPQAGSTVPDPAAACAAVAAVGVLGFGPTDPKKACTMQAGPPTVAVVEGTVAGRPVNSTLTQRNGCAIAQWQALAPLFAGMPAAN